MGPLMLTGLRGQGRRLVSAGLAVLLGVAFLAATLLLGASLRATIEDDAAGTVGMYAAVAAPAGPAGENDHDGTLLPQSRLAGLRSLPGVTGVTGVRSQFTGTGEGRFVMLRTTPALSATTTVVAGRLPSAPGEVAMDARALAGQGVAVGQRWRPTLDPAGRAVDARVVGHLAPGRDAGAAGAPMVFAATADIGAWTGRAGVDQVLVAGDDPVAVRDAVAGALGSGWVVRTGAQEVASVIAQMGAQTRVMTMMLVAFAAVALFVCALVIANTFTILLAQRSRQVALLRCVGAQRDQVFRSVLAEAIILGGCASTAGVAAGYGLTWVFVALSRAEGSGGARLTGVAVTPVAVLAPIAVGILVTVLASVVPAHRATRVAPLVALRPDLPAPAGSRTGRVRLTLGALAVTAGVALLLVGARNGSLSAGIPGGLLSFLGVLAVGPVLVPALVRAAGAAAGALFGVPGRFAVTNAGRNPARAAATTSAVLVGVTLITMMGVGAHTGSTLAQREVTARYPLDAAVGAASGVPQAAQTELGRLPGVAAAAPLRGVTAPVQGSPRAVLAVDDADAATLRHPRVLAGLTRGTALMDEDAARGLRISDGDTVTVGGARLRARVEKRAVAPVVVTAADLPAVGGHPTVTQVWLRFTDDQDPTATLATVEAVATRVPGAQVGGAAPARAEIDTQVRIALLVVIGMLAIAVLIALVGVGNTLGLSVLERTRESALLRALGLTRGQLRGTLAVEALLLTSAGVVLGLALGTFYGWAGAAALLREFSADVPLLIPWTQVGATVVIAVVAGVLASVLPARRAARVAPAAALAAGE